MRARTALAVLAFSAVFAVSYAGVVVFAGRDASDPALAPGLAPTIAYGALVARAWVLGMPLLWGALVLEAWRLVDAVTGTCSVCGYEDDWTTWPVIVGMIFVFPLTLAAGVGVFIGVTWRDRRDATRSASASAGSA